MKRQVIIGVIFIISIALLYWGINFLKGLDVLKKQRTYYVEYEDVSGLLVASPVSVSGFRVGQVTDITFIKNKPGALLVKFVVYEDLDIPTNTIAKIESSDLLGSKAIVLQLGNSNSMAKSGSYLEGEMTTSLKDEVSIQMLPLKAKVESLLSSFDSALAVVQYVFNENTRDNLNRIIESINMTLSNIESATSTFDTLLTNQQYKMANIITNVEAITLNIKNNNKEISNIINNFSQISDTILLSNIQSTFENANNTMFELSEITKKINSGQGSVGLLLDNDSMYIRLNKASQELEQLLEDMKTNPDRYLHFSVFGKKNKKNKEK